MLAIYLMPFLKPHLKPRIIRHKLYVLHKKQKKKKTKTTQQRRGLSPAHTTYDAPIPLFLV